MSYNTAIPASGDPRALSQGQILANYQAINTVWSNNHVNLLKNNEFQGMHNVLTMRPQSVDPATAVDQIALYNKLVSSIPELFFMPHNSATPIQMTYPSLNTVGGGTQYSFVAGPFIVYMGFVVNTAGVPDGTVVTLTPGTTLHYVGLTGAIVTSAAFVNSVIPTNINTPGNSFTISHSIALVLGKVEVVYYLAIGI